MDNQNNDSSNEKTSIFENNGEYIETSTVEKKQEENVVTPIVERRDLADKTIDAVEDFIDTKDHKKEFETEDLKKYKVSAMISYIPLVSIYFVATNKYKQSKYLNFHVNQGITITLAYVIIFFLDKVVSSIFSSNKVQMIIKRMYAHK